MFSPFAFEFPKNVKPMKIWCSRFFFFLPISWLHYMEQLEQWQETEWERAGMTCRPPCGVQVWPKWRTCIVCSFYILLISGIRLVLWTSILQVPKLKKGFVCVCVQSELFPQSNVCFIPLHNHLATPFQEETRFKWLERSEQWVSFHSIYKSDFKV